MKQEAWCQFFCHESQHIWQQPLPPSALYCIYSILFRHGCLKTPQSDSHDQGGAQLFSCLMQSQSKLTSLHEAPCQQEGSFLLSERGGHIVPFYFQKHVNTQCSGMGLQPLDQKLSVLQDWQVSSQGIASCLKLRHLLWLSEQTWHWHWTAWSWDHTVCNCTYESVTKPDLAGV